MRDDRSSTLATDGELNGSSYGIAACHICVSHITATARRPSYPFATEFADTAQVVVPDEV